MNAIVSAVIPRDTFMAAAAAASSASSSSSITAHLETAAAAAIRGGGGNGASWTSAIHVVGPAWIVSSAILTTFSTTSFLKFGQRPLPFLPLPKKVKSLDESHHDEGETSTTTTWQQMEQGSGPGPSSSSTAATTTSPRRLSSLPQEGEAPPQRQGLSRPALLTLYRFGGSLVLGLLVAPLSSSSSISLRQRLQQTRRSMSEFAGPAGCLFLANFANSIALNRIGISLTYTSKCGIPLLTVLLTVLTEGVHALPSVATLSTLVPIAAGIGLASWNSPTFGAVGFAAAVVSCTAQAALNVWSKRAMMRTGITGPDAQRSMVAVALLFTLATNLCTTAAAAVVSSVTRRRRQDDTATTSPLPTRSLEKFRVRAGSSLRTVAANSFPSPALAQQQQQRRRRLQDNKDKNVEKHPPLWITLLAVVSYHVEYVLSFMFIRLVDPITYGTCDAIRRLSIIIAGRRMFGGEAFSTLNLTGIALAIVGALAYSTMNQHA